MARTYDRGIHVLKVQYTQTLPYGPTNSAVWFQGIDGSATFSIDDVHAIAVTDMPVNAVVNGDFQSGWDPGNGIGIGWTPYSAFGQPVVFGNLGGKQVITTTGVTDGMTQTVTLTPVVRFR